MYDPDLPSDSLTSNVALISLFEKHSHWYVSGYGLTFENLANGGAIESLFRDAGMHDTMFRIVVKSNMTMLMAVDLLRNFHEVFPLLDKHGFQSVKVAAHRELVQKMPHLRHKAC
jgi:hypothetical protein